MKRNKIALLVDSSCDVPKDLVEKYNMYVMPLKVIKDGLTYVDGVDITANEVAEQLPFHDFKTSLPSGGEIQEKLEMIKNDGYEQVLIVTISSGLSGTNNIARLVASEMKDLEIVIIDTLSIGMGAGLIAIRCAELIESGLEFKKVIETINQHMQNASVYFCVATLEYLQKGGRIGKVSALLGGLFDLKPIITCNNEGIYTPIAKVRSRQQSLKKTVEFAANFAKQYKKVNIALAYTQPGDDVEMVRTLLKEKIGNIREFFDGQVSPILVVHTGPGLVGIAIYGLDE